MQDHPAEIQYTEWLTEALYHLVSYTSEEPDNYFRKHKTPIESYIRLLPRFWDFIWRVLGPSDALTNNARIPNNDDEEIIDKLRMKITLLSLRSARLYHKIKCVFPYQVTCLECLTSLTEGDIQTFLRTFPMLCYLFGRAVLTEPSEGSVSPHRIIVFRFYRPLPLREHSSMR